MNEEAIVGFPSSGRGTILCVAEDRPEEWQRIKLLVLSIRRHAPHVAVAVFRPNCRPSELEWLRGRGVDVRQRPLASGGSDGKPEALLQLLSEGRDLVWWIDSDIILAQDLEASYRAVPNEAFVASEEDQRDDGERARLSGFSPRRLLPRSVNSGVLRVSASHVPMLKSWQAILESSSYLAWRGNPARPKNVFTDQDVLTSLLASDEYADVPLHIMRRGREIIHFFGISAYPVGDRLQHIVGGKPVFIHAQGWKMWRTDDFGWPGSPVGWAQRLYAQLSPYQTVAREYRDELDGDLSWLDGGGPAVQVLRAIGFSRPALTGLPVALVLDVVRYSRRVIEGIRGVRAWAAPRAQKS